MQSKRTKAHMISTKSSKATLDAPGRDKDKAGALLPDTKSAQEYVTEITSTWSKTLDGIFETGRKLIEMRST